MNELRCEGLEAAIGEVTVVRELEQGFRPGEFWGLLGANGAGKTTLLRHLAGLLAPRAGRVLLGGRALSDWRRRALARVMGMMQQDTRYVFDASVLEAALTGRHPHLAPFRRESEADIRRARSAIDRVDLGALAARSVTSLSGGEARRLAFAMLLVQDPELMLLDEPTNHLDFRHQVRVMRVIGDLVYGQRRVALTALHDVNLAATYCSHVLLLFGDGEWQAGRAPEMLTVENLERLYQCPVSAVDTPDGRRFHPAFSRLSDSARNRS